MELIGFALDSQPVAQGATRINSALDSVGKHIDAMLQKAQKIQRELSNAMNFGGADSRATQRFTQQEQQFNQHQARLQQIAARNAASLNQIEARRLAQIETIRERAAQQEINRQRRLEQRQAQQSQGGFFGRFTRNASLIREAGESIGNAGVGLTLLTDKFLSLGRAAVKSAFDIDKNVNTLKAFLGSSQAAEERLKQLIALSQKTPGLTTSLASTLDAQLRTSNVRQSTIDRILPSIGRLNAVSPLGDPQKFAQNLQQLITQGFERTDLKELVGQSPIAGQILQQLFNVDSPTNSKAIRESAKKLGIQTTDDFFKAFAEAAGKNNALANVTESLETRFQKLTDRINVALRPIGLSIVKALEPIVEKGVPIIEKLSKAFDELSPTTKQVIIALVALTTTIGPLLIILGSVIQTLGALGNLAVVLSGLGGIAGISASLTGMLAAAGPVLAIVLAITAALGLGYAAWTKYGASAESAANNVQDVNGQLQETPGFLQAVANDLFSIDGIIKSVFGTGLIIDFNGFLQGTAQEIAALKDLVELFNASFLSTIKTITIGLLGPLKSALGVVGIEIGVLTSEVNRLSSEIAAADQRFADGFSNVRATQNRIEIQNSLGKLSSEDQARASLFLGETFSGIPSGPNFVTRNFQAEAEARGRESKSGKLGGGVSSNAGSKIRRAESEARQLRAAEEALAKARVESLAAIQEKGLNDALERERDSFEKRLIDARGYYENRKKIELELFALEERRIKGEAAASAKRLNEAKDGSPEALREIAQLVELQSKLRIIEIDRKSKLRELTDELEKNTEAERERRKTLLEASAALQLPILKKQADFFQAQSDAKRDAPETKLRLEEIRLQSLADAGLIREQQLTDALILSKRALRAELVAAAEARKAQAQAEAEAEGKFFDSSRFDEEIARLKVLGSELTRAEQLRRRFAEQGVIDYSRLNEGVEELLASQKGLTEIFSDFRANIVADQFSLIDQGVDALTKRLGVLGSALGQLLKDLAKLALSKVFQKLFGLDTGGGQSSSFGFGGGSARSTSPLAGLGGILTGGGGSASGGGGFLTGGFAGGPGAGGILSGGSSGGGGLLGGILGKIPGLGKLFGAGGGGNPGGVPIFTQGSGGAIGTAGSAAQSGLGASLGGLAAGGAIAGGGLLGSLAGGKSPIGRLLGGVGGSLLGGFGAALLNPALLPVLFSNPITAIIGGALLGGALLFNFLGGREQRKFRKTVEDEYQIKVDGKQQGTELYKSIKALGEEQFGKGKFGKKMLETIRLQKAQEQLAAYAEATGQENNALVKKFRDQKELTSQFDPRNQFVKRYAGGPVNAFQSYVVGEHRAEVFTPSTSGQIYPSFPDFAKAGAQLSGGDVGGGWTHEFRVGMQRLTSAIARFEQASARIEGMPPETVLVMGARRNPDAVTSAWNMSVSRSTDEGRKAKDNVYQGR